MSDVAWDDLDELKPMLGYLDRAMGELLPTCGNPELAPLAPVAIESLGNRFPRGTSEARGCLAAGLWLLADELDRAHTICQAIATPHGSAWHAIMHRREGDFGNSLYWWRRAGALPWRAADGATPLGVLVSQVLNEIPSGISQAKSWRAELGIHGYDPAFLVRFVERRDEIADPSWNAALLRVQRLEWASLFAHGVIAARQGNARMGAH